MSARIRTTELPKPTKGTKRSAGGRPSDFPCTVFDLPDLEGGFVTRDAKGKIRIVACDGRDFHIGDPEAALKLARLLKRAAGR